jgi:hypothetical protein
MQLSVAANGSGCSQSYGKAARFASSRQVNSRGPALCLNSLLVQVQVDGLGALLTNPEPYTLYPNPQPQTLNPQTLLFKPELTSGTGPG